MTQQNDTQSIVVGVDGSRFGREALRWALDEGARRGCAVRAVMVAHVAPVVAAGRPTTVGMGTALGGLPGPDHLRRLEETDSAVLGAYDDPRLNAELLYGSPPEVLSAASRDAQLLVLGGHGQLFEAVLGSVSRYGVRHASCPVVVIPGRLAEPAESVSHAAPPAVHGHPPCRSVWLRSKPRRSAGSVTEWRPRCPGTARPVAPARGRRRPAGRHPAQRWSVRCGRLSCRQSAALSRGSRWAAMYRGCGSTTCVSIMIKSSYRTVGRSTAAPGS